MSNKVEKLEDLCQIKDRTEPFCRYAHYVVMHNIHCPYYQYDINVILSKCNYYKLNKFLVEEVSK